NTKDFHIQHSYDGRLWENIGTVLAAGQSSQEISYSFSHLQPTAGNNFYRIQQNDIDGRTSFSKSLKVVRAALKEKWKINQNPAVGGKISIQLSEPALLSLYNSEGKLVWEKQLAEGFQQI